MGAWLRKHAVIKLDNDKKWLDGLLKISIRRGQRVRRGRDQDVDTNMQLTTSSQSVESC